MTSNDIETKVKNEVLDTYPEDGISIVIPAEDSFAFQLTNTNNEITNFEDSNDNGMSIFNFYKCENILKQHYNIPQNSSLIILKYEKLTGVGSEKSIQYEVYNPISYEKLNLSPCDDIDIDIEIPVQVDEEIEKLYKDLKENGYDLFDGNGKFYLDICTPYTAENGADILLADRLYYFFSKVVNISTCPSNCEYSTFSIDIKYLTCQCEIINEDIDIINSNKFIGQTIYDFSNYVLKYTSYKTLKCYKLVFSFKHFIKNGGSIFLLILFFIYIGFFVYYILKGISPLKVIIGKFLFDENEIDNKLPQVINVNTKNNYKATETKSSKGFNPPKKLKKIILRKDIYKKPEKDDGVQENKNNKENKNEIFDTNTNINKINNNKNNNNINNNATNNNKNNIVFVGFDEDEDNAISKNEVNFANNISFLNNISKKNDNKYDNKSDIIKENNNDYKKEKKRYKDDNDSIKTNIKIDATGVKSFYLNMNLYSSKKLKLRADLNKSKNDEIKSAKSKQSSKKQKRKKNKEKEEKPKKVKFKNILESNFSLIENNENNIPNEEDTILDDYELNHMPYLEALELDKRSYCKIYLSLLMRDQIIMHTCFNHNDYNLFYVKFAKIIFIIASMMTMNAIIFADKSFHKLFISGVNYYFSYQILQIVLSVLITHAIKIILNYITLTDRYIYEIKAFKKKEEDKNKIFNILKYIKLKLLIFYIAALVLLFFYWYYVSAFCAVYPNTQKIYFIDCLLSFIFFSIIPFIIYAVITLLRVISLKDINRKRFNCLYNVSKFFPFFY
jgi:hypothetical protein